MSEEQAVMNLDEAQKSVAVAEAITKAQKAVLTQKTPREIIKVRKGRGGMQFKYVEHSWVTATLNEAFNWAWSWDVLEWKTVPESDPSEVFVLGRLTVHTPRGDVVKTQFGTSNIKTTKQGQVLSIGDDLKAASSDALKKAASLLGIALDLYSSDIQDVYEQSRDNSGGSVTEDLSKAGVQAVSDEQFASAQAAVIWGYDQGCFEAKPHAQNAYNELKREKNPQTAKEMAKLWREYVFAKVAEPDEAQVGA